MKAQDMPQFKDLAKNSRFGEALREYKIGVLSRKIEEFKKEKGLPC